MAKKTFYHSYAKDIMIVIEPPKKAINEYGRIVSVDMGKIATFINGVFEIDDTHPDYPIYEKALKNNPYVFMEGEVAQEVEKYKENYKKEPKRTFNK
ncbi:MAG: hypothetical protein QXJ06_00580 [Candidatus Aenigmatarchaeota archaeon]